MADKTRPGSRFRKAKQRMLGAWTTIAILILAACYLGVLELSRPHVGGVELRFDTFVDLAERGRINDARILDVDSFVVGTYRTEGQGDVKYNAPYLKSETTRGRLIDVLIENRVPTKVDQQNGKRVAQLASTLLPGLILMVLFGYLVMSYRRGTGLFGIRSGARKADPRESRVTFADVAGQDAAVTELREVKDFLSDPQRFFKLGAQIPKGILLYGPPGCGKTLLAQAVAGESGAAFYSISGSDFVELYVGVGASRVRELFKDARENAPAIVFIDELDAVARRRRGRDAVSFGSNDEQEQALNQILTEMDGFSPMQGIIVIGATNRPDTLDPALLRPGRFDRTIGLDRPDEQGRLAILRLHARSKPLDSSVDLVDLARRAIGLSGADLASVMNEGALLAARSARPFVSQADLSKALQRILEAPERQHRLSMRDRTFRRFAGTEDQVTFADVAGLEEALDELAEVKEYLAEPQRFIDMGARPPRGFLLVGPPGCGKTLLARAVANEANAAFFSISASEFVEAFVGEGAGRVRDLFAEAKAAAPAVIFIDEIDAVGARRGASSVDGSREREQTLNQILTELDGFELRSGVTVMAASNRPEILDEALVRPGRFDRTVVIGLPDRSGRRAILDVHARDKRLSSDVDLDAVARMTQGFSGADLANVMNEAALLAARQRLAVVPMSLVEEAVERVGVGISRTQALSGDDRTMVAYHEVGHALVGLALPGADAPHKVSIVSRGLALGASWSMDQTERLVYPKSVLLEKMAGLLGGRAAEELVFGEPGSGAADDLRRVGEIARRMVSELGMSEALGPIGYGNGEGKGGRSAGYSEDAARTIDAEVRRLVDEAHGLARSVLTSRRDALENAAQLLIERETLSAEELQQIVDASSQPGAGLRRSAGSSRTPAPRTTGTRPPRRRAGPSRA